MPDDIDQPAPAIDVPPLSADQFHALLGERDVRIEQLRRALIAAHTELAEWRAVAAHQQSKKGTST